MDGNRLYAKRGDVEFAVESPKIKADLLEEIKNSKVDFIQQQALKVARNPEEYAAGSKKLKALGNTLQKDTFAEIVNPLMWEGKSTKRANIISVDDIDKMHSDRDHLQQIFGGLKDADALSLEKIREVMHVFRNALVPK